MVAINRSAESKLMLACPMRLRESSKSVKKWVNAPATFAVPREGMPTEAPPGTVEKILVFIAREGRAEELFHPFDAKHDGCLRPLLFYLELHEKQSNRV